MSLLRFETWWKCGGASMPYRALTVRFQSRTNGCYFSPFHASSCLCCGECHTSVCSKGNRLLLLAVSAFLNPLGKCCFSFEGQPLTLGAGCRVDIIHDVVTHSKSSAFVCRCMADIFTMSWRGHYCVAGSVESYVCYLGCGCRGRAHIHSYKCPVRGFVRSLIVRRVGYGQWCLWCVRSNGDCWTSRAFILLVAETWAAVFTSASLMSVCLSWSAACDSFYLSTSIRHCGVVGEGAGGGVPPITAIWVQVGVEVRRTVSSCTGDFLFVQFCNMWPISLHL
jgi:hypothetical protein